MTLWYHPESDALFVQQGGEWQNSADGALCGDVSDQQWAVDRYNQENPGHPVHLFQDREDGLGFCLVCLAGECELTTDCPGHRVSEARRAEVCAGRLDYWSGVWLETPHITDKDVFAASVNPDGETYDGRKVVRWLFEAVTGKAMSKAEADKIVEEAKQLAKDRKNASA